MDVIIENKKKNKLFIISMVPFALGLIFFFMKFIPKVFLYTESQYEIGIVHLDTIIQSITFEGKVDFKSKKIINSHTSGMIKEINVQEGDAIRQGQRLLLLDTSANQTELRNLKRQLSQLNNDKDLLLIKKGQEELDFQYNLKLKKEALNSLKQKSAVNDSLFKQGALSSEEVKKLETQISDLEAEIEYFQENHSYSLREFANKLTAIDEKIENLTEEINLLEQKVNQPEIKAEFNGIILESLVKEGQTINENQVCFTVHKSDEYSLKIKIPESQVNNLKIGGTLYLKFGGKRYLGKLEQISSLIKEDQSYGFYVDGNVSFVKEKPPVIMANMNFTAEWPQKVQENILAVERGPYISDLNQNFVFRITEDGQFAEKVGVTFGIYDDKNIQIINGLTLGDRIIISSYTRIKEKNRIKLK